MRSKDPEAAPTGQRERSKVERQAKIISAARMLFTELGYDAATLNQIAAIAGLGKGTIFNYVTDKRDIIFLIFHHDMSSLIDDALASAEKIGEFSDKILKIAELHYRLYAENPKLSRILLNEAHFHAEGLHLEEFRRLRSRLIQGIEHFVALAQERGVVAKKETASFVAQQVFFCFSTATREWLASPNPKWRPGLLHFERSLKLLIEGVGAR